MDEAYDSWAAYWDAVDSHVQPGRATQDQGSYLPDPRTITVRGSWLRELKQYGACPVVLESVMQHDAPDIAKVRAMVDKHGPAEAMQRVRRFAKGT